jgi:hypothetical protein
MKIGNHISNNDLVFFIVKFRQLEIYVNETLNKFKPDLKTDSES